MNGMEAKRRDLDAWRRGRESACRLMPCGHPEACRTAVRDDGVYRVVVCAVCEELAEARLAPRLTLNSDADVWGLQRGEPEAQGAETGALCISAAG